MRAEDQRRACRHLAQIFHEHRALRFQVLDDELVVDDFVPHVDRGTVRTERALDDLDRAIDAGAESAGLGEKDLHVGMSGLYARPTLARR